MAQRSFPVAKDTVRRQQQGVAKQEDGGGEQHLFAGNQSGYDYSTLIQFSLDWSGVAQVTSAYMILTTKVGANHVFKPYDESGVFLTRLATSFTDPNNAAGEDAWSTAIWTPEDRDTENDISGITQREEGAVNRLNMTAMMGDFAPPNVRRHDGQPGKGKAMHGVMITHRATSAYPNPRMSVAGMKHPDANARPYIELNYVPIASANTLTQISPQGPITEVASEAFTGSFERGADQPGDIAPARFAIELFIGGSTNPVWTYDGAATPTDVLDMTYRVPLSLVTETGSRHYFQAGYNYEWRARSFDNKGVWTEWTGRKTFSIASTPPWIRYLRPNGAQEMETLNNVFFIGDYMDFDKDPVAGFQIQMRTFVNSDNPSWADEIIWDSGRIDGVGMGGGPGTWQPPTNWPPGSVSIELKVPYGGPELTAGTYSWRMRAWDSKESDSGWSYESFTLTKGYEPEPGSGPDNLTGYAQRKLKARILIKGMRNKLQTIRVVGTPTGGGYKITFGLHTATAVVPYNATAAQLQTILESLSTIAPGDVVVTLTGGVYSIVFGGYWSNRNVPKLEAHTYTFTGPGAAAVYVNVFGDRVPGYNVAVVEDAANIGASEMYNAGGELFFSLPAIHPQVSVIEPYQTHYVLEQFRGESWRMIAQGLITDFDATDNDVVFYGQDYIALLGRQVDDRFNSEAAADAEAVLYPDTGGGSKYVNRTIREIVTDQLQRSIHTLGSPLSWFTLGTIAPMEERVSIWVSFKERLPFIAGLIESHKAGTGKRTRLMAVRAPNGGFSWVVKDDAGRDRPNMRMEYGGLVQGFRVIPFGNFTTRLHAIGRVYNQLKVEYMTATAPAPAGQDASWYEENYGVFSTAEMYQDVTDVNDLKRRAKQSISRSVRVGKALALHLRPGALAIKDGWDICDSVLVDIDRGVVSTTRMGSGYWTIWGWTWELKPDGEEDITLSLLPKEDASAPDLDLIPSSPIASNKGDWQIEARDPDDELDVGIFTHVNSNTGHIFQRDTTNGGWVDRTEGLPYNPAIIIDGSIGPPRFDPDHGPVFIGGTLPTVPNPNYPPGSIASIPGTGDIWTVAGSGNVWEQYAPPVIIPIDTTPPDAPLIRGLATLSSQQNDGTSFTVIQATVGYASNPGYDDLNEYIVESTRFVLPGGQPDWTFAAVWSVPSADVTGTINSAITLAPLLPATTYFLRAAARDRSGNRSGWSATSSILSSTDSQGPPVPTGVVTAAGFQTIGVRWEPSSALDYDYTEVQWRVAPAGGWTSIRVSGTLTVVTGLTNGTTYEVRLRSVDTSGNVLRDTGVDDVNGNPVYETVKVAADPNAGWVSGANATPSTVPGSSLVWDSAMIADVFAGEINADWITAGTLRVGGGSGNAVAISVFDSGGRSIGRWSTAGIEMLDPDNPGYKLVIDEASLSIYTNADTATPFRAVSLTPLGIDAASITFGSARGGHNLVQNSSFELGRWGAAATTLRTWTVAGDWNSTRLGSDTNITTGANDLTMTVV